MSDSTIFKNSDSGKALANNSDSLFLPGVEKLPGSNKEAPHVFVGDEAFPLKTNLMRPFAGRRNGIAKRSTVKSIVKACTSPHNWLRINKSRAYFQIQLVHQELTNGTIIPGQWRTEVPSDNTSGLREIGRTSANSSSAMAHQGREIFADSFERDDILASHHLLTMLKVLFVLMMFFFQ